MPDSSFEIRNNYSFYIIYKIPDYLNLTTLLRFRKQMTSSQSTVLCFISSKLTLLSQMTRHEHQQQVTNIRAKITGTG